MPGDDDALSWWTEANRADLWRRAATVEVVEVPRRAGVVETLEAQIALLTEAVRGAASA